MDRINYEKLSEITVRTQEELDMIPLDFKGRIYIEFGSCYNPAVVENNYCFKVVAREHSSVVARGNSSVEARENSSVVARGNSSVVAWEHSSVEAWEHSSVEAREHSSVVARGNSSVVAWEHSSVEAWEHSSVVAWEHSSVEAWEHSSVEAWEHSSVVARGNVQVFDLLQGAKIQISGNARIVYNPKTIYEFMDFYGIKHDRKKAIFYKAVRKQNGVIFSNYNPRFTYEIGETKTEENLNKDVNTLCGTGIHISHLDWALSFGSDWNDLTIIEVEVIIDDIILPKYSDGKVRTNKVKVLREIPLSECGLYGKIISNRIAKTHS